jgi:hypothetical protein
LHFLFENFQNLYLKNFKLIDPRSENETVGLNITFVIRWLNLLLSAARISQNGTAIAALTESEPYWDFKDVGT